MKEDRTYNIRFSCGLLNAWDFDLRGAGHLYVQPGKDYFLENCPKSLLDRVVGLVSAMNVTYKLTDNKKGCFETVNCINYSINDPKSLLGRLRTNKVAIEEPTEPEVVEEVVEPEAIDSDGNTAEDFTGESVTPEVIEESVESEAEALTEEPATEVVEEDAEVVEEISSDDSVESDEAVEVTVTKKELESMSKPKLEEIATSLGIESVQTKTKKILKSEIIDKLGL